MDDDDVSRNISSLKELIRIIRSIHQLKQGKINKYTPEEFKTKFSDNTKEEREEDVAVRVVEELNDKYYCRIHKRSITRAFIMKEDPDCIRERGCNNCSFRENPKDIKRI